MAISRFAPSSCRPGGGGGKALGEAKGSGAQPTPEMDLREVLDPFHKCRRSTRVLSSLLIPWKFRHFPAVPHLKFHAAAQVEGRSHSKNWWNPLWVSMFRGPQTRQTHQTHQTQKHVGFQASSCEETPTRPSHKIPGPMGAPFRMAKQMVSTMAKVLDRPRMNLRDTVPLGLSQDPEG